MRTIIAFLIMCSVAYADYAVLITAKQYRPGINEIGDVIGIYPDKMIDNWKSEKRNDFEIIKLLLPTLTVQEKIPETKTVDSKLYWKDGEVFKEVKKDPKYKLRYKTGVFYENYSRDIENTTTVLGQ